jgi:predicted nucleotidyltransferase component of viral defense system
MSQSEKKNMTASILQRLKNYSEARQEDRGLTITNYAIERFLYRFSLSQYASQFVLKGAQLFRIWTDSAYRPTRDLDLLRFGNPDMAELERIFRQICTIESDSQDGIVFLPETVQGEVIREESNYDGIRIKLEFRIGRTGEFMQIDIGFGDAVNPPAAEIQFPSILEMPSAKFRAYCQDTVIAEKVEAMVSLGYANSRMKDFYDVYTLSKRFHYDGTTLKDTIQSTFSRRNTEIPNKLPVAFSEEFSHDALKQTQWNAFVKRNSLEPTDFADAVEGIRAYIYPVFVAINDSNDYPLKWQPDRGWSTH